MAGKDLARATRQTGLAEGAPHYHGHRERLRDALPRGRRRRRHRLRAARAGAVPRHPAARRQAARQGADREVRLVRRGAGGAAAAAARRSRGSARPPSPSSRSCRRRRAGSRAARSRSGRCCRHGRACSTIAAPPWRSPTRSSSASCSSTSATSSSPTRCSRPARSTTRRSIRARWSSARSSCRATAIILVHNHPSGDPTPSRADIQMTQSIVEVAKPLGISVHDHIIVGKEGHASLKGLKLI